MNATPEQKQHMLDLVKEMEGYANTIQNEIHLLTIAERVKIGKRMTVITKEMKQFRKDYPDD